MDTTFDLERYLDNSKKVETVDLNFSRAQDYPVTAEEVRCLTYMMDVELNTLMYVKALLRTCAVKDPEVVAFLNCWAYEEFFHGRALRKFLEASGAKFPAARAGELHRRRRWREYVEEVGAAVLCWIVRDFGAAYLAWGAVQELSALEAYGILARRTGNPILRELLQRIIKDERRHFSFYFNKARPHLQSRTAQRLTSIVLKHFWSPVGDGLKHSDDVRWTMRFIFGGEDGYAAARRVDASISRLPGLSWFNLMTHRLCNRPEPGSRSTALRALRS